MQYYDILLNNTMYPSCMNQDHIIPAQEAPVTVQPGQMPVPEKYSTVSLLPYTYPQNFPYALQLIMEGIAGEREDRLFYDYLIGSASSQEDKDIIAGIRDDEIRHFSMFRIIYYQLTGQQLPPPQGVPFEKPSSYCDGIRRALIGEQNAVRKYRRILFALQNRIQINMLTEIITDELRHGSLYNYLYSKNSCSSKT